MAVRKKINPFKVLELLAHNTADTCLTRQEIADELDAPVDAVNLAIGELVSRRFAFSRRRDCFAAHRNVASKVLSGEITAQTLLDGTDHTTGLAVNQDGIRVRAWRAMRNLKRFTVVDLCELAANGSDNNPKKLIGNYVSELKRGGILAALPRRTPQGRIVYMLLHNSGKLPPYESWQDRKKGVRDRNTGEFFPYPEVTQ